MKLRLIMTCIKEYELNPEHYPPNSTIAQMAQIDLENATADPEMTFETVDTQSITCEIVSEETKNLRICLALITDAYQRMSTNRDPEYRAQQITFCEKQLEKMTQIVEAQEKK